MSTEVEELICPYCGHKAELKDSRIIYGKSYGLIYLCSNHPVCMAFVGVHKGSTTPLGTLANRELRDLRKDVHSLLDWRWKTGKMSRRGAYIWLSKRMGLPRKDTHIGLFDIEKCKQAIKLLKG